MRKPTRSGLILALGLGLCVLAGCKQCRQKPVGKERKIEPPNENQNEPGAGEPSRKQPRAGLTNGAVIPASGFPLPGDADAVLEINAALLRNLPFWPAFERRLYAPPFRRFIDLLKENCGLDPLVQVEHVLGGVRFESQDGLMIVKGSSGMGGKVAACIPKMATAVKVSDLTIRQVEVHGLRGAQFRFAKVPPVRFTVLDENRFALSAGTWLDTAAAIEKGKAPRLGPKSHIFRVRRNLGKANLAWIVFLGIPPGIKDVLPSMAAVARVRTVAAALNREAGSVSARVILDMRKAKSAEGLVAMLRNVLPQLKKLRPAFVRFDPFLRKVQIRSQGSLLVAELTLNDAEIKGLYNILTSLVKKYMPVPRAGKAKGRTK